MSKSVRLSLTCPSLKNGDLLVKLVTQSSCEIEIEAEPSGDYGVRVRLPAIVGSDPVGRAGDRNETPHDSQTDLIHDADGNVIGVASRIYGQGSGQRTVLRELFSGYCPQANALAGLSSGQQGNPQTNLSQQGLVNPKAKP